MTATEVHHVVTGPAEAPVVVLSNSLGSTHAMWDPQAEVLAERFRVVRYDTRGHGKSPVPPGPYSIDDLADDVIALLDRLEIRTAHFVGLSLGGMTGLRLAARDPERIDRLVVLCTAAHLPPASAWLDRAATVRRDGAGAVAESVVARWFTPRYLQARPDERIRYEEMVAATSSEGYAGCCQAIAALDLRAGLLGITAPTLAVAGADDPATPPARLELIATSVPNGRLLVAPDSAHLANAEQPALVTGAIVDHLTATA